MEFSVRTIRLDSSPRGRGLWCGPEELTLAGHPLLEKTNRGFAPVELSEIQRAFDRTFGEDARHDARNYLPGLAGVARSLNKGDLPLAMIGSVLLKLPDIPQAAPETKLAFDDTQPRDDDGRWTSGVTEDAKSPIAIQAEATAGVEEATVEGIAPRVLMLLGRLARILPGPVALAAGVLIPTNESNIHSGEFPGFEGLHYRSDEGVVTISRLDAAGNIETLYHGFPDADGFYHDDQGEIIGQHVGTGVMFDNEALADFAAKPSAATTGGAIEPASMQADDGPKVCPDPTPENINRRSQRSLAYQSQITGLPYGFDVAYLGVRFDGCDEQTGRMIEAKGLGTDWMLNWPPEKLYQSKFYLRMMRQAERQNAASNGRGDDYYFASERAARFFGEEFRKAGYTNIVVHHVEAIMKMIKRYLGWLHGSLWRIPDRISQ